MVCYRFSRVISGNVNNNTEDNKDSSHRTKQNFGKPRSKFDAPRSRPEHSGRAQHSSSRSYNSSSRAKSSGIPFLSVCLLVVYMS